MRAPVYSNSVAQKPAPASDRAGRNVVVTHQQPPAVFLDRDGTLIEDRGHLRDENAVVFFKETVPALLRLQESFRLFIVTNQSGVSKGDLTLAEADRVNNHVVQRLAARGVHITAVYCCPHQRTDGCECMKPKPFFLHQAARDYGLDLRASFVIGDHPHDVELALNVGATGIYVLTGHGEKHRAELRGGELVAADIGAAAALIFEQLIPQTFNQQPQAIQT